MPDSSRVSKEGKIEAAEAHQGLVRVRIRLLGQRRLHRRNASAPSSHQQLKARLPKRDQTGLGSQSHIGSAPGRLT